MGINFHETVMGRRFYDVQLPSLIKSIDRLAKAVEEQNALLKEGKEVIAPKAVADRCE